MPGKTYERLQREHPELVKHIEVVLERKWISAVNPKKQKQLLLLKTYQGLSMVFDDNDFNDFGGKLSLYLEFLLKVV